MSVIDTLVTDRTRADVTRLKALSAIGWDNMTRKEKAEYVHGDGLPFVNVLWADGTPVELLDGVVTLYNSETSNRGAYNYVDFNRVGEAMIYIQNTLNRYGYAVTVAPRTDWKVGEKPTPEELLHYLDDIATLRAVMQLYASTPQVPSEIRTPKEANDIEQILTDISAVVESVLKSYRRSGQFMMISGYLPPPTAESDLGRTWEELDAMRTTWANWQVADWYLLLYGNLEAEGEVV